MIRVENVSMVFKGSTVALRDVSTEISRGEFVFLVGSTGSGKTTLIRLLLREEEPSEGRIYIAGRDIAKLPRWRIPYLRRSIGCVFQDYKLLPNKTVYENVAFALEVIGRSRTMIRQRVPEMLALVGLGTKTERFPDELSGGEQQRVSIARAMVNQPPILLADEPTGNLDPTTSIDIMKLLGRINAKGTTVVMATHDHAVVDQSRKRVIELDNGKVVRDQVRGVYGYGLAGGE
ncbi:MAG: cell division ATP-binding protein FtsE [Actinomycetota bacterium]